MAFIEMTCNCSASFQYETENELRLELMSEAFRLAHVDCSYMNNYSEFKGEEKTQRYDVIYKEEREKEL